MVGRKGIKHNKNCDQPQKKSEPKIFIIAVEQRTMALSDVAFTRAGSSQGVLQQLWEDREFTDVTLVTADGRQLRAHRAILGSASKFFHSVLAPHPHPSPLLYLGGMEGEEVALVLRLVYLGEVAVEEARVARFLQVCGELQVQGLAVGMHQTENICENVPKLLPTLKRAEVDLDQMFDIKEIKETLDETVNGFEMSKRLLPLKNVGEGEKPWPCLKCDCKYMNKTTLQQHVRTNHEGVKFACDNCDYQATQKANLKKHKQSMHEGLSYFCDQCTFTSNHKANILKHRQTRHQKIKYLCELCDFQTSKPAKLTEHKTNVHK